MKATVPNAYVGRAPSSRPAARDELRRLALKTLFTQLGGITVRDWWRLLADNQFAIAPAFASRAGILFLRSIVNSLYRQWEDHAVGPRLDGVTIKPPLFILGHWRSGTTLLHHLLACDEQFTYPTLYQVLNPHTFLTSEATLGPLITPLLAPTRLIDNVAQNLHVPSEDEFALCVASLYSPYLSFSFPRAYPRYERYLTFRGVSKEEITCWQEALVRFLKKLTLTCNRPILLKSPAHTCRIGLLYALFPDARFVHIRRHPYAVFQSTQHLNTLMTRANQFQHAALEDADDAIIARYKEMYHVYFEERALIPEGRLVELAFEDLEADPLGQIRLVYEKLGLSGFDAAYPRLEHYVHSLDGYAKNAYPDLPMALRQRLST